MGILGDSYLDKESILAAVNAVGGKEAFQVHLGDNAVKIVRERSDLRIVLTIPYQVHELFLEVEHLVSGQKIEDWFDYYGEAEKSGFWDDLKRFLFVLQECDIRINVCGKSAEYGYHDQWHYFCGYLYDKYVDQSETEQK